MYILPRGSRIWYGHLRLTGSNGMSRGSLGEVWISDSQNITRLIQSERNISVKMKGDV